jgi:multidrug resistance efflux pump
MGSPFFTETVKPWRRLLVGGALGLILALLSFILVAGLLHSQSRSEAPRAADAARPNALPVVVCLGSADVRGGVVSLYPTVSGRVTKVCVEENDPVEAGQVLLRLDDRIARTQLREAEAGVQAAEAQLAEALKAPKQHQALLAQQKAAIAAVRHDLKAANLSATQKKRLFESNQLSKDEADAAAELAKKLESVQAAEEAKLDALHLRDPGQEITKAEADLVAKTALRDRARDALGEYELKAPAAGTPLRVFVSPGDVVGPQSHQAAVLFCPRGARVVRAEVEQEYAPRVILNQRALVEDAASSNGPTWKGRVVRIADWYTNRRTTTPDMMPVQDVRTLECLVELDPDQPPLRIGQRVRVKLFAEVRPPASEHRSQ